MPLTLEQLGLTPVNLTIINEREIGTYKNPDIRLDLWPDYDPSQYRKGEIVIDHSLAAVIAPASGDAVQLGKSQYRLSGGHSRYGYQLKTEVYNRIMGWNKMLGKYSDYTYPSSKYFQWRQVKIRDIMVKSGRYGAMPNGFQLQERYGDDFTYNMAWIIANGLPEVSIYNMHLMSMRFAIYWSTLKQSNVPHDDMFPSMSPINPILPTDRQITMDDIGVRIGIPINSDAPVEIRDSMADYIEQHPFVDESLYVDDPVIPDATAVAQRADPLPAPF